MGGPGSGRKKSAETIERELRVAQGKPVVTPMQASRARAAAAKTAATKKAVAKPPKLIAIVLRKVAQPTGSAIEVQGKAEELFYNTQKAAYLDQNKFDAVSDLADLDALLMHELLDFRYTSQLSSGKMYDGIFLPFRLEEQFRQNKLAEAKIIGELKRQLGLTRASRDQQQGSVADYIANLRLRAREFGINRNNQAVEAITLMNELSSIVGTFDRSNEFERRKTGIETDEQIVAWVRDKMVPKFHSIDAEFRANGQKYWVGTI
jgi:hypothetical protein